MENQIVVSVIVPVFHGKKYISAMVRQIELCAREFLKTGRTELVFVNDAPDETLPDDLESEWMEIVVINTTKNRGIHGARVYGLEYSHGNYILFLDQDDRIVPEYLESQYRQLGNAAAVVCRCIQEEKQYYHADYRFEEVITKEHMMTKGCSILSPGQVLLRRNAIPVVWKQNIMTTNCADDFFLWLCMMAEDKAFVLNQRLLFEHVVNGINFSMDTNRMIDSEQEMFEILSRERIYSEPDLEIIRGMMQATLRSKIANLVKFRKMFLLLNQWLSYRECGYPMEQYLSESEIKTLAIYGCGYLGKRFRGELEGSDIKVCFFIDRNAPFLEETIPVYMLEEAPGGVDAVIIAMAQGYDAVKQELIQKYGSGVYSIGEIEMQMESRLKQREKHREKHRRS